MEMSVRGQIDLGAGGREERMGEEVFMDGG